MYNKSGRIDIKLVYKSFFQIWPFYSEIHGYLLFWQHLKMKLLIFGIQRSTDLLYCPWMSKILNTINSLQVGNNFNRNYLFQKEKLCAVESVNECPTAFLCELNFPLWVFFLFQFKDINSLQVSPLQSVINLSSERVKSRRICNRVVRKVFLQLQCYELSMHHFGSGWQVSWSLSQSTFGQEVGRALDSEADSAVLYPEWK